jgi:hypothetical protein
MSKAIILKQNSPEIRQRIKDAGISVCPCAGFDGSKWLDYHVGLDVYFDVHGLGYSDETMSGEEHLAMFLHETKYIIECRSVEEFIQEIKKQSVWDLQIILFQWRRLTREWRKSLSTLGI